MHEDILMSGFVPSIYSDITASRYIENKDAIKYKNIDR